MNALFRRVALIYWPLALWALTIVVVREYLNHRRFDPAHDDFDAWLLFGGAVVISVSVLITLGQTRNWTLRALGILSLISFDAGIYGLTGSVALWHWHVATQRDLNWFRAMFLVGAPMLAISQIWFIGGSVKNWRAARKGERP